LYNANDLQLVNLHSRRTRLKIFRLAAGFSLALWLFMATAEICTPLHAWLHGGSIPDDDDCAVVAIAHGNVDTVVCDVPTTVPVTWIELTPRIEIFAFAPSISNLPSGRAPPIFSAVS
jgi:hypothetical protein